MTHPDLDPDVLLQPLLLLDLETTPDGRLLKIGALHGGRELRREGRLRIGQALAELDAFAAGAAAVLGHNLLDHDLPLLRALKPDLALRGLPVLDTLFLSPLAFPENPYHRLVKDYKLVSESLNDPVADARLAGRVFLEQRAALAARGPAWLGLLRYAFSGAELGRDGVSARGLLGLFDELGARLPADPQAALAALLEGRACRNRWREAVAPLLNDPRARPALAYGLSWITVAGGNSVLPPWVRLRFREVGPLLAALRDRDCGDPGCGWCRQTHDPVGQLRRWFGFEGYRPAPAAADGGSLQQRVVSEALDGRSLLAVLPTGGGKSLCYQVPALARYQRRGALTVVISPLQALMKDQVDGLNRRVGVELAGALSGLLIPPERGELLERVRLGDIALLYVSPEQFRNRSFERVLAAREIAAWVFDEAHCLSKWGHDFRPDYLYCARFIREFNRRHELLPAPVCAYTATAKPEVRAEITDHVRQELGLELILFQSGVERDNLRFEVRPVSAHEKPARIAALLHERLGDGPGAAVVYCATRANAEATAGFLSEQGFAAAAFHAGLEPPQKRAVQEAFLGGGIRVVCATNAFGMGIDKEDVRLVIHADAPGSLENYLQEAGRAGRDRRAADCVLLFAQEDIERQFRLGALSELSRRDIAQILRALRRLQQRRGADRPLILTSGELTRDEDLELSFDAAAPDADTRVKTALAWLERAGFVERNENHTRVFQGRPRPRDMAAARERLDTLDLPAVTRARWEAVLAVLYQADPDQGLSADQLAELPALRPRPGEPPVNVLRLLDRMAGAGLLRLGMQLTAWLRPRGAGAAKSAGQRLETACAIERAMLDLLREQAAEADPQADDWLPLDLRLLNQALLDAGLPADPELLRKLLKSLAQDGRGLGGERGSLEYRAGGRGRVQVRLRRGWGALAATADRRRAVAQRMLEALLARAPDGAAGEVLVEFALEDLRQALQADALLAAQLRDPLAALERALLYLHEQQVIVLQQGLAVFRQAMTLRVLPEAKGRRYGQGDYAPLAQHYRERVFQVHVMAEYARLGLARITQALELVGAYFTLDRKRLLQRFFPGREQELQLATSPESFRAIVEALVNPEQQAIVAAPLERNLLVLAGPGAGKTRVVVHRVAYLLRVERVAAAAVLVLCYNRHAALELRRRLMDLLGPEARGVTVQTFHGLAMALTGHAWRGRRGEELDFGAMLEEAIALLRGERELAGLEADELRDRLLAGYRCILVDEYQDIDARQYELISAIAGRSLDDPDSRLGILAVGDDDQNIYAFRGSSVAFIRRFAEDYAAETRYLVENYRAGGHLIAAANALIAGNRERMKTGHPIRIDRRRRDAPPGGVWQALDPVGRGRVQVLAVADAAQQAAALVAELRRLKALRPELDWSRCAVLSRTRAELELPRAALEAAGIPLRWALDRDELPSPFAVREIAGLLDTLRAAGLAPVDTRALAATLPPALPWTCGLQGLLADLALEAGGPLPAARVLDELAGWLHESRRAGRAGEGVMLGTAHGAKGLEFEQVFIPGGWTAGGDDPEAERRLFYVALTRAREGAWLFRRADVPHPHLAALRGDCRLDRPVADLPPLPPAVLARRFALLAPAELFLSYAGRQGAGHPIHAALAELRCGDPVRLTAAGEGIAVVDGRGRPLARLSAAGRQRWGPRLEAVERAAVLAVVRRDGTEEPPEYRRRLRVVRWELPVVEVVYAASGPALCDSP